MVQTLAPGASSIRHAAEHDAAGFLAEELERRRLLRYPPFSHLIGIMLADPEEPRLVRAAGELGERLRAELPEDAQLLGPALMFRARGRYRRRFLIKAARREPAVAVVADTVATLAKAGLFRGLNVAVDVAPQ